MGSRTPLLNANRKDALTVLRPIFSCPSEHTMEGPYSARFPSSLTGEKSRQAPVLRGATEDRHLPSVHQRPQGRVAMTNEIAFSHQPVMQQEIVDAFAPACENTTNGWLIDATLGGAGHSSALLNAYPQLQICGIDQDDIARTAAAEKLAGFAGRTKIVAARFDALQQVVAQNDISPVVGVLFDLGVSSPQLDQAERGFSYRLEGPLDMRMDQERALTAEIVVNTYSVEQLAEILSQYGDERFAFRIAKAIEKNRPIHTTTQLSDIVKEAIPAATRRAGGHPAKRTFQAIRIEVNAELEILATALRGAIEVLVPGGRLAVLSYHSGEDRIVKEVLRNAETGGCECPATLPCACGAVAQVRLIKRGGQTPTEAELRANLRSQSARLRVAEKLAVAA